MCRRILYLQLYFVSVDDQGSGKIVLSKCMLLFLEQNICRSKYPVDTNGVMQFQSISESTKHSDL